MYLEVISDGEKWKELLSKIGKYDFVHTYDFHKISEENGEGSPVLFAVFDSDKLLACWPALKRQIPGTDYVDLSCVYGYGGPVFAVGVTAKNILPIFFEGMKCFGAVTLFSRMHPVLVSDIEDNASRGEYLGDVVVLDVNKGQSYIDFYRGGHRREIVNSFKKGLAIKVDWDCSDLASFQNIYQGAMLGLNARDYYFFSAEYFKRLAEAKDFKVIIIFAEYEGAKIAASMFIVANNIMQYYLSGTDYRFRNLAASKAIIAKAHELADEMGLSCLILGGGVGSSKDSLFRFKAGFSDNYQPFYVIKKVLDEEIYRGLCADKEVSTDTAGHFPPYRSV
ncbi:peptidoglycan bridge formation glycyltransferase FemA/FemB family protein [Halopseudomonas aestusnigri]|uniref:peptidoglycan bridge formation glycyltransferase FemA/FemB family protein n=1 Tax=Halopseudomonas aestusnigri TaxID=857252 RepID=UPI0028C24FA1|nr:hypothetical protein YSKK_26080 [Halopseudomonas aestusnigri]